MIYLFAGAFTVVVVFVGVGAWLLGDLDKRPTRRTVRYREVKR